ncbi:insulinase family protein [Lachnospiraceae bacterium ZAX-1]
MNLRNCKAYELLEEQELTDIKSKGHILRHKKSGAKLCLISNGDDNKVFYIGFRTPAQDSTGAAHILEHSVLCGSKQFPAKDPFVELAKGSLNTFLNAITYPDKTIYPVASCNEKDFQNLMHVYLDAVFYPNIYQKSEIFQQEGWHYEMQDLEEPITLNGVVYNEMKGAFSSPEGVLEREILTSLFPDTSYQYESGGDPKDIPDLSYEEFIAFHKKFYHPANSYIYLYGDLDMEAKLNWIDEQYLSKFDLSDLDLVDSAIAEQKAFTEPVEIHLPYSISSTEPTKDNTYLSYNLAVDTILNEKLYIAFDILDYALLSAPGAPLKQALLDAKIGKDIMSSYDNSTLQPIFSIIAKNSDPEKKEEFLSIIRTVLTQQVNDGIHKKSLLAALNSIEFKYREADFGHFPKGLLFGIQCLDSWLYDESRPFTHLGALGVIEYLKGQVDTGYFENIIKTYFIENTHASIVVVEPQKGLNAKIEKELEEKLRAYKQSLKQEDKEKIVAQTHHLRKYQEEPSTKEEREAIPLLTREDLKKEAEPYYNKEIKLSDIPAIYHGIDTNKIAYINLMFDTSGILEEDIPYLGLLKSVLGYVDTELYSYRELANEINLHTGGVSSSVGIYANVANKDFTVKFEIRTKVLYHEIKKAMELIETILSTSSFSDTNRIYEIVAQLKSRLQMALSSSGHSASMTRAMSYFSEPAKYTDLLGGIDFYRTVDQIESNFKAEQKKLVEKLTNLMHVLFRPENLLISIGAEEEGLCAFKKEVPTLTSVLYTDPVKKQGSITLTLAKKNEGFMDASKVQYVSRAGNFKDAGFHYTGALKILKAILSYDYLWLNIRVKGGAYGCMSGFSRRGDSYVTSYRDPNLVSTNEIYEGITDYLRNFTVDARDMTKYVIGVFSDMDAPLTPSAKVARSANAYLTGLTIEAVQQERNEVLAANEESIRSLADLMESVLKQDALCVIGNEEKLREHEKMFLHLENLY